MEKDYRKSKKYTKYYYLHQETNSITWTFLTNSEIFVKKTMLISYPVFEPTQEYSKTPSFTLSPLVKRYLTAKS